MKKQLIAILIMTVIFAITIIASWPRRKDANRLEYNPIWEDLSFLIFKMFLLLSQPLWTISLLLLKSFEKWPTWIISVIAVVTASLLVPSVVAMMIQIVRYHFVRAGLFFILFISLVMITLSSFSEVNDRFRKWNNDRIARRFFCG
jgi:hypothetical protein